MLPIYLYPKSHHKNLMLQLEGFAKLPADTFAKGGASGQYNDDGSLKPEPLFKSQPVQGFSGVQFADDAYLFLSDNGFGTKLNSQDYLLRLYRVEPNFKGAENQDGSVNIIDFIQFSDPDKKVPFPIKNETTNARLLTGFDFDVESFVVAGDGTFWVGDEFGPYLLHFDQTGKLLNTPIPTPNFGSENAATNVVRSPDNPDVLAGKLTENLNRSRGYEGLAINPDKTKLYPLLEGTVAGDPENTLRIYEFDIATKKFTDIKGLYRKENPDHAIGDIAVINENEYLVIERDNLSGDAAQFKKVFKIDLSQQDANGYVSKQEVGDLLNITDPNDLNEDSSTKFKFPFITIEDVLVIDKNTILIANDNNYPGTGGRSATAPDETEILLLELDQPLNLDARVGIDPIIDGGKLRFGTPNDDELISTRDDTLFGGDGNDTLDASTGKGNNRLYGGAGNDEILTGFRDRAFGGDGDDILDATSGEGNRLDGNSGNDTLFANQSNRAFGGNGDDTLFAGTGDNTLTGGDGKDQFWIIAAETPVAANTITDFQADVDVIGLGGNVAFVDLAIAQTGSDTTINLKDGTPLAILKGVDADTISINNFVSTASRPLIIGHRGASGDRPEHTLAAYELAINQGADYIEPDLVATKDGILVARHENEISETTNVADIPAFANRKTTKSIDGEDVTGWFTEDFTLKELKTLKAKERLPELRDTSFDGLFEIPTLQEVIELAKQKSAEVGRTIGIYPETKHPTYFDNIGLSLEAPLVATLNANGYTDKDDAVFIQSFETANLKQLDELTNVPLIQLLSDSGQPYDFTMNGDLRTYADLTNPNELTNIATYADGIGPSKRLIVPADATGKLQPPTSLIDDAHTAGLLVHAYTFRNEDVFLAPDYQANPELEYEQFFSLGLDGLFSDFPGTGFAVANRLYPFTPPDPLAGVGLLADT